MNEIQYISKEKRKELEKELEYLKTEKRMEIAEALETARGFGDLSENAEYQEARRMQAETEARIKEVEGLLARAKIVSKSKKNNEVAIGSKVTLEKKGSKAKIIYELVGASEADVLENKISNESPLGEALLGKKKGEQFDFETPGGKVSYKVVDIK
jgi:transcription elongation factor GreA